MTRKALLQAGDPPSQLYEVLHRVADRLEPAYRDAFMEAVLAHRDRIDLEALESAFRRRDPQAVLRALRMEEMVRALRPELREAQKRTLLASGEAVAAELAGEVGVTFSFDRTDPGAVLAARRDAGVLIARISDESRDAVRAIVGDMFSSGVTPDRAARRIRDVVGMRTSHAGAVVNFRDQLREIQALDPTDAADVARAATDRRLDAATKAQIRRLAREGGMTDELLETFTGRYRKSLHTRRALDIARTEGIRAAHAGQQQTWRQAVGQDVLSTDRTRRLWIVTPDDRLRETHAAVPSMNDRGVGLEEPFQTPVGAVMYPPLEPNCRCGVGLTFVDTDAVL